MRWLAKRLRSQRLTLLVVPAGVDMHALLKQRLMLLLGRRDSDVDLLAGAPTRARGLAAERRQQRQSETTAFFDDWTQMARSGALDWRPPCDDDRVLLVMPQLGDCLRSASTDPAAERWLQTLVQGYWALDGRAHRPVQALMAIDETSLPLLELLRLQGLPVDALLVRWLADGSLQEVEPAAPAGQAAAAAARSPAPRPKSASIPASQSTPTPPNDTSTVTPTVTANAAPHRPGWALGVLLLAGGGLLALALGAGSGLQPGLSRAAALQLAALDNTMPASGLPDSQAAPAGPAATTPWPLMVAAAPGGMPPAVVELAGRVGPAAGLWLAPQLLGDWAEGLHRLNAGPGLLVLRYDALRAARQADAALAPRLLTPLYTEPLLAIVKNNSPLTGLQQLRGQRVRAAAAGTADALSASALLQALFGAEAPAVLHAAPDTAPALPQADDEVLLTVGRPGRPWTDALPPGAQGQHGNYRLLALAPADSISQRALQQHLPVQVDGPGGPVPTLGVMSFLAASPAAASSSDDSTALLRLAQALCRELPALQQTGDAAWRGLQPGQQLTSGWPSVDAATPAWRQCGQPQTPNRGDAVLADAGRSTAAADPRFVPPNLKAQP